MAGNARGEQRRSLILQAAVRVVARSGVGALTHRAAATEAGVSLASVTYHFPGINDLRRATFTHAADMVGPDFAGTLNCGTNQDAAVAALAHRWQHVGLSRQTEFVTLLSLLVESLHDPELRDPADKILAAPAAMLVAEGCSRELAEGVVAALVGLALISLAQRPDSSVDGGVPAAHRFEKNAAALFTGFTRPEATITTVSGNRPGYRNLENRPPATPAGAEPRPHTVNRLRDAAPARNAADHPPA